MVWNAVESIRFNHFVVKYSIFVSVVERNHHTALIGGVQRRSIDLLNDYGIICVVCLLLIAVEIWIFKKKGWFK